jgi:hypothetical protein
MAKVSIKLVVEDTDEPPPDNLISLEEFMAGIERNEEHEIYRDPVTMQWKRIDYQI